MLIVVANEILLIFISDNEATLNIDMMVKESNKIIISCCEGLLAAVLHGTSYDTCQ